MAVDGMMLSSMFLNLFLLSFSVLPVQMMISVDWTTGKDVELCRNEETGRPCKTLNYALKGVGSGTQIYLHSGQQHIDDTANVANVSNVTITGHSDCPVIECAADTSIVFHRVNNVAIENLVFNGCGENSSVVMNERNNGYVIYFIESTDIDLSNIVFNGSTWSAVMIHNTTGMLSIVNCTFIRNGFGSLDISFSGVENCDLWGHYVIENCSFNDNGKLIPTSDSDHFEGGGINIVGDISSKEFIIKLCNFTNNKAIDGGAICLHFKGSAANNFIQVESVNFTQNTAKMEGGGLNVKLFGVNVGSNRFEFTNLSFFENTAGAGGGAVFKTMETVDHENTVTFDICEWINNTANFIGGAMALYPVFFPEEEEDFLFGKYPIPLFNNCNFSFNRIIASKKNGVGIIYSDSISLNMSGNVNFKNNTGSPIYISSAHINILNDSQVRFIENTALKGGGIALMHGSNVMLHRNTIISFSRNKALESGGAIFYDLRNYMDYFHLKHCFLRYYDSSIIPNEWESVVDFIGNSADGYGKAIYAASLKPCSHVYQVNVDKLFQLQPFNNSLSIKDISTDPSTMSLSSNQTNLSIYPGLNTTLPIITKDELGQQKIPILLATCAEVHKNCPYKAAQKHMYITDYNIAFNIKSSQALSDSSFLLRLSTLDTREIGITVNITIQECPAGYMEVNGECQCTTLKLPGVVSCNVSHDQTIMSVGYWAGCQHNHTSGFLTAFCPPGYCSYRNQNSNLYLIERDCSNLSKLSCANNRVGRLCGDCIHDYSVLFHSPSFGCWKCTKSHYGVIFYAISELLPVTVLFCFIIIFDISLTSGPLSSFVFFAQVIDIFEVTTYQSYVPKAIKQMSMIYKFIFGFFNFDFFQLDSFSFCIIEGAHTLDILALKYVTTLYTLFLISFLFVIMRFRPWQRLVGKCRKSDSSYTVMNGVVAFVVITYSQCAKVSFQILGKTLLHSVDSKHEVVRLAGSIDYLSTTHLQYAIPAFIMIFYLASVPLALILHPLYFYCKRILPVKEQSCKRLESHKISLYLMPVMDAFQCSYKEDARVYAGLLFLYRLIICIPFAIGQSRHLSLELILILILTVRTVFHPFRSKVDNVVESLMLADLAIINAITVYNGISIESDFNNNHSLTIFACVQFVLIFVPVITAIFVTVLKLFMHFKIVQKRLHGYKRLFNPAIDEEEGRSFRPLGNRNLDTDFDPDQLPARMIEEEARSRWTVVSAVHNENGSGLNNEWKRKILNVNS